MYTVGIHLNDPSSVLGRSSFVGGNAIDTLGVSIDVVGKGDTCSSCSITWAIVGVGNNSSSLVVDWLSWW